MTDLPQLPDAPQLPERADGPAPQERSTADLPARPRPDRVEVLRQRLQDNDARLRRALRDLEQAARALTPAAAVSRNPIQVVLGAFVFGLVLGFATRTPSHRRLS